MNSIEIEKIKLEQKNVVLAYLLWWFLGILGIHRLYTNQSKWWLYIILFIVGFLTSFIFIGSVFIFALFMWWVIDGIRLNGICKIYNLELLEKYERNLGESNDMQYKYEKD
jgi:TM2 domain-containing membrane protein YozV